MSCCGQKRQAWRPAAPGTPRTAQTSARPPVLRGATSLAYLGDSPIVVAGASTGLTYLFGPRGKVLAVDARDVPALLATGHFTRA